MKGINPQILVWAREQMGLSVTDVATTFKKDPQFIKSWEKGLSSPSFPQLEKLANKYKRPTAIFFFPKIPEEESIKQSFRTLPEQEVSYIQPHLRHLIRKAKAMQINLSELNNGKNPAEDFLIDKLDAHNQTIDTVARKLRNYLGVDLVAQKGYKKTDNAFKQWRLVLEKYGIFVFKEAFKDDGFSGFCLYDDTFPVIYINNSQHHSRQIFTLFHELAHLLFGTSSIEMLSHSQGYLSQLSSVDRRIEIFCNAFAGKFLVPDDAFVLYLDEAVNDKNLNMIANKFVVSREVILRKFLNHKKIDSEFYDKKVEQWKNERKKQEDERSNRKQSGGNPNFTKRAYLGENYMEMAFSQYYKNNISTEQLADYLDIKVSRIPKMESLIFEDGGRL